MASAREQELAALACDLLEGLEHQPHTLKPERAHPALAPDVRSDALRFWLRHRVAGIVTRLYTTSSLSSSFGEVQSTELFERARRDQHRALGLQQALRGVLDAARDSGLGLVPFKGVVDSQALYGDPGVRSCGDLDLLASRAQLSAAQQLLARLGYRECGTFAALSPRAQRWWLRVDHSIPYRLEGRELFVDLHFRMNDLPLVALDHEGWQGELEDAAFLGVPFRRLNATARYLSLLTHTQRSLWTLLRGYCDLVRARALAVERESGETRFAARLQALGAVALDRKWLDLRDDLARVASGEPVGRGPLEWLLRDRSPTPLEHVRESVRSGRGAAHYARCAERFALSWEDLMALPLPDALFPLHFALRPVLTGARLVRRGLAKGVVR